MHSFLFLYTIKESGFKDFYTPLTFLTCRDPPLSVYHFSVLKFEKHVSFKAIKFIHLNAFFDAEHELGYMIHRYFV